MEKLFIEQIRNVSVIVSTPFHRSIMPLIGPALIEVRLRGRELVSFPPQRRQTDDFSITVEEFSVAVEAYSAALDAINGRGESGGDIPKSDLQRALALRRAFTSMAQYAAALAEEASTVDV